MKIYYSDYTKQYFNEYLGKIAGLPPQADEGYEFARFIERSRIEDAKCGGSCRFELIVDATKARCFYDSLINGLNYYINDWQEHIVLRRSPDISSYFVDKVENLYPEVLLVNGLE